MAIQKYTNFDAVNNKTENEGKYLQAEDLFIISKNEIEETDFGECKYDVMEVAIYDTNNNLIPQKSGNSVAYIKSNDIGNYMYSVTNRSGKKELVINYKKLLNTLGFRNGIFKLNLNFVRYKVGSENELERVWIQEISPSREEVRILPLKTKFKNITEKNQKEFDNINNLNKDFKYYKKSIFNSLASFENNFLEKIDSILETKFGKDFFNILKKDFGLSKFANYRKKIFEDYKISVEHYLNNKYYDISESNFGKPSEIRFEECETYDFKTISDDISNILFLCIQQNTKNLKRRDVSVKSSPKEFLKVETQKLVKDSVDAFETPVKLVKNVFQPEKIIVPQKKEEIKEKEVKLDVVPKPKPEPIPIEIKEEEPIKIILPPKIEDNPIRSGGGRPSFNQDIRPYSFDNEIRNDRMVFDGNRDTMNE
jgi:hypothetical protein